ncbi:MAG: GntR family transcriptional regulator [Pseudomonadota bacterium]
MSAPTSNEPRYRQVYAAVMERIFAGELGPGAMLPSEVDLGAQLGVSQGTARKALMDLERDGVVERRQGKGTFVAATTAERALFQFFRLRTRAGEPVVPELVSERLRKRKPLAREAALLAEDVGSVVEIARARSISGANLIRETLVLPATFYPGLMERAPLPNTLYVLYQQAFGISIVKASEQLRAVLATVEDAATLEVKPGEPMMEVQRQAHDLQGRVVELRTSRYVTRDLHYAVELG